MTLTPAYGRDSASAAAALADFKDGKDFILNRFGHPYDGKPINREQVPAGTRVTLRYGKLRKVAAFVVGA